MTSPAMAPSSRPPGTPCPAMTPAGSSTGGRSRPGLPLLPGVVLASPPRHWAPSAVCLWARSPAGAGGTQIVWICLSDTWPWAASLLSMQDPTSAPLSSRTLPLRMPRILSSVPESITPQSPFEGVSPLAPCHLMSASPLPVHPGQWPPTLSEQCPPSAGGSFEDTQATALGPSVLLPHSAHALTPGWHGACRAGWSATPQPWTAHVVP